MHRDALLAGMLALALSACEKGTISSVAAQVAVGNSHACAVFDDGFVRCWGEWKNGQRGEGIFLYDAAKSWLDLEIQLKKEAFERPNRVVHLSDVAELTVGNAFSCARRKDGTIWCWGSPDDPKSHRKPYPQRIQNITDAVQLSVGESVSGVRRSDGSVWFWQGNQPPKPVPGIRGALDLSIQDESLCVLLDDGSILSLENWTTAPDEAVQSAKRWAGLPDVQHVRLGPKHGCLLTKDANVKCWGSNDQGQLGDDAWDESRPLPIEVPSLTGAKQLVLSKGITCGAMPDGRLVCLGGKAKAPWVAPGIHSPKQLSIRTSETFSASDGLPSGCAVMDNGALACWGSASPTWGKTKENTDRPVQVRW